MPDVETMRKQREAAAHKRDELAREERKRIADKEREREMKALEKRRWEQVALAKQEANRAADVAADELKSLQTRADMGDAKAKRLLEEKKKSSGGPRPYTGSACLDE